jgi:hypothetical protein
MGGEKLKIPKIARCIVDQGMGEVLSPPTSTVPELDIFKSERTYKLPNITSLKYVLHVNKSFNHSIGIRMMVATLSSWEHCIST